MSELSDKISIRETIKKHDRNQFETRFDYSIDVNKHGRFDRRNKQTYFMDVYFYIPKLMGINAKSYTKSHFYEDTRPILRFKEPQFSRDELLGVKPGRESPLSRIEYLLEELKDPSHPNRIEIKNEAIDLIRYFACCFISNFRRKIRKRCRTIKDTLGKIEPSPEVNSQEHFTSMDPFLRRYFFLIRRFEELRNNSSLAEDFREELSLEMLLAEEYCFYRFREGVALAVETFKDIPDKTNENYLIAMKKLRVWSRFINWFERSRHFLTVDETSSPDEREGFLSRLGNIKKYLSRVLYLEVKPNLFFAVRAQAGYMIAAAIAAFFYFLANLTIFYYFQFGGFSSFGNARNLLGFGGVAIVFSFVVAYVLKDRIKEIGRNRFESGIFGRVPDYLHNIYYANSMGTKVNIGKISESVEFIRREKDVPKDIRRIRGHSDLWDREDHFDVLYYRKKIELDSLAIQQIKPNFFSVKHIVRFSIRRFLTKLDDPIQIYLGLDKRGAVQEVGMPKVYYIGIAVEYAAKDRVGPSGFDYQILVVDKNGLVRIDEVARSVHVKDR